MISIANEKQNITKQPKKQKNQKGILNVQPNKFMFREEKQPCGNGNLCSAWLKPIKPVPIYSCPVVRDVRGGMLWEGGFLIICLIFQVIPPASWKCNPLGSRSILRAPSVSSQPFTKGHHHHHHQKLQTEPRRKNMSSAFIRQMERGRSELQGASGYNRRVGVGMGVCMKWCEWSIEMTRIWVEIVSYGRTGWYEDGRRQRKTDRGRRDDGEPRRKEVPKRVNKDGYRSRTKPY